MRIKISIITVVYNGVANIEQTINAVLSQDYLNKEYIVIDGGSKDGTVDVLNKYSEQIKYISEKDKGIYDAMNKGLSLATGDVIGFIGADDFYPSNDVLTKVAETFQKHNTDSVYGDKQYVSPFDASKIVRYWKVGEYHYKNWLSGWMTPHLSFYLKKSCYDTYGGYDVDMRTSADYELMLRMLYKHRLSTTYIPEVLMTMRDGGQSNASWKHRIKANQEDRLSWKMNGLKPKWYTLYLKPLSKIPQLFKKK